MGLVVILSPFLKLGLPEILPEMVLSPFCFHPVREGTPRGAVGLGTDLEAGLREGFAAVLLGAVDLVFDGAPPKPNKLIEAPGLAFSAALMADAEGCDAVLLAGSAPPKILNVGRGVEISTCLAAGFEGASVIASPLKRLMVGRSLDTSGFFAAGFGFSLAPPNRLMVGRGVAAPAFVAAGFDVAG